ncbi:glycosyltransferase family 4 protein [Gordonia jinhuaensis]|uniref:Biofilm formation protein PslH n=1 Tax=Gordonia jinhuaensis TaxID=1517702 RepID=A0A916WQU0_9ACTN|nr:glycosyltransferase [Gordonia jinhuaensis]GGB21828.1 biofilm formation protein PslH [Gordonia jinhuaensis]
MKVTFVLPKDPSHEAGGDVTMPKLVAALARESHDVNVVCLSAQPESTADGHIRVFKPAPRARDLAVRSILGNRSLVHTRFSIDGVTEAVDRLDSDRFVVEHAYMAEPLLHSRRHDPAESMAISTSVSEVDVWRRTRGRIGQIEAPRIARDELRTARAARSVGSYSVGEARHLAAHGVARSHFLDLTLPPNKQVDIATTGPRLLFVGDRKWPPNQQAYERLLSLWPQISADIPHAELLVIGQPDPAAPPVAIPPGVTVAGFVPDLDEMVASCRALAAPVLTGGGVRVKLLDMASRGMPVVATSHAVGSLGDALSIETFDDTDEFVDRCRRYLLDRECAAADGRALYERNSSRWFDEVPHRSVEEFLR